MNIVPEFDEHGLLPVAIGKLQKQHSPYFTEILTVLEHFAFSEQRRYMLFSLLRYRAEFYRLGFSLGTHFIGGALVEQAERDVGDNYSLLPLATQLLAPTRRRQGPDMRQQLDALGEHARHAYRIIGPIFAEGIDAPSVSSEAMMRAAFSLSLARTEGVWKGILSIPLSEQDDAEAWRRLSKSGTTPSDAPA